MAELEDKRGPQDAGELDEALLKAISHPLRHRLLGLLDERVASPNELARELGLPLGRVSYHIRLLADLGAIELVRTEPRRGALEHFYRAVTRAWFSEEDWARLPRAARRGIVGQNLQRIFSDVTAAVDAGGFDGPASQVTRKPLELDQRGLDEVTEVLASTAERVTRINAESADRRGGAEGVSTELALLHFERSA
jgi:DNA-binding transcriptional ArsR family regulator